jgi:hypothetical protein
MQTAPLFSLKECGGQNGHDGLHHPPPINKMVALPVLHGGTHSASAAVYFYIMSICSRTTF